jgi:hypothetical protein
MRTVAKLSDDHSAPDPADPFGEHLRTLAQVSATISRHIWLSRSISILQAAPDCGGETVGICQIVRRRLETFAICTIVVITAGCGDGRHFRLAATRSCLNARGYETSTEHNWLFKPTEGTLDVSFGRRYVALNFGKDAREARRIRDSVLKVYGSQWPIAARGNVAYVWSAGAKAHVHGVLGGLRS